MEVEFICEACRTVKTAHVPDEQADKDDRLMTRNVCGECGIERVWIETTSSLVSRETSGWEHIDIE